MALPTLIEELLSLSKNPETDIPGSLLYRVGIEYFFPYIPPYTISQFGASPAAPGVPVQRGFGTPTVYQTAEVFIFFRVTFGKLEPGAFRMRGVMGGIEAVNARLDGYILADGLDVLFFCTRESQVTVEIENLTNKSQYFVFQSHYLIVPTPDDWQIVRDYLKKRQLSVTLPLPGGGA